MTDPTTKRIARICIGVSLLILAGAALVVLFKVMG